MQPKKLFTDPKLSPVRPGPDDIHIDWYVWFRFFDVSTGKWKQLRFKKGINQYKNFKERLSEANSLKQALKLELQDGWNPLLPDAIPAIRIYTIPEAVKYILSVKAKTLRRKSIHAYKYITDLFLEWVKANDLLDYGLKDFSGNHAQQYMDWLLMKKNYTGRTFNDHLIVLRTFFNCFIEREWITRNPFRSVKRKRQTVGRNLAYTEQEKIQLAETLYRDDRRMWYFTQFIYHCFIRRTELTTIRVKHVDILNGTIVIPGETAKNNTQESVVIPKGLIQVIQEMNLGAYHQEDFLFGRKLETGPRQFKSPNWISSRHNRIVKELGMDAEKGLYSWKHTGVIAYYYATGKDIYSLMRQLRHRDLTTTTIYLKSLGLISNDAFKNASAA